LQQEYFCRKDKGKPDENRGRKAMGLQPHIPGYDCQAAENE
jgi:hypothetical protein